MHIYKLLTFAAYLLITSSQNLYTLQLLSTERGARCLDGTPTGVYYHQGTGANKDKFMIYMNSGGYCSGSSLQQTLQSCYERSTSSLGSTAQAKPQKNLDGGGLLSTLPESNPVFYDWTKIYFIYCDGSQYTGYKQSPISYKDKKLYFRGYNNVMEQFRFMEERFDFYNKQAIVLTGVSAGGMATYFYSNYLMENTKTSKIYAIPDSGIFLVDYFTPLVSKQAIREIAKPLFNFVNDGGKYFPINECGQENKNDITECYTTSNLTKYLKAPMLIVQSPYDPYSIENIVYTQCLENKNPPFSLQNCNQTTRQVIEDYRMKIIAALKQIRGNRTNVGVWAPSCSKHGFVDDPTFINSNFRVPFGSGVTVSEAIQQFLKDPNNAPWYLDEAPWPINRNCNGVQTYLEYE